MPSWRSTQWRRDAVREAILESPPRFEDVPKTEGGLRRMTILDPDVEARYEALVSRVVEVVERALGREVLANRLLSSPTSLAPWRPAWRSLLRARRRLAARGRTLLHADVRECYPRITPGTVQRSLYGLGAETDDVRPIVEMLDELQEHGGAGLPIGPDPSAVLANGVLVPVDRMLTDADSSHVRWVDDVWAAAPDGDRAARILDRLRGVLDHIGLEVNEEKTIVIDALDATEAFGARRASGGRL